MISLKEHLQILNTNFKLYTNQDLIPNINNLDLEESLYNAPFVLVSHDNSSDPIFNYANKKALDLWQMTESQFLNLPSRLSAEPENQFKREEILNKVLNQGYIENYEGIRINSKGERFIIKNVFIWNLYDNQNTFYGQAAKFEHWEFI